MPTMIIHGEPGRYTWHEIDPAVELAPDQYGLCTPLAPMTPGSPFSLFVTLNEELRTHCLSLIPPSMTLRLEFGSFAIDAGPSIHVHVDAFNETMPVPSIVGAVDIPVAPCPLITGPGHLGTFIGHIDVDLTAFLSTALPTTHLVVTLNRRAEGGPATPIWFMLSHCLEEVEV